jgi:hypothetical protein
VVAFAPQQLLLLRASSCARAKCPAPGDALATRAAAAAAVAEAATAAKNAQTKRIADDFTRGKQDHCLNLRQVELNIRTFR